MVVGEFTQETDLVIIGGGPAGYAAAFRAAELGIPTLIVDSRPDNKLGGVCLHEGCIPSKTLLHIAELIRLGERAGEMGVKFAKPTINIAAIHVWKNNSISKLAAGLDSLARKHSIERITGLAHFEDSRMLAIQEGSIPRVRFKRALIATGSIPKHHPHVAFDGQRILTPSQALKLTDVPQSMLIVGHDYMAVELATIFSALGSAVTLVNEGTTLLAETDPDLSRPLLKSLKTQLAALHDNVQIKLAESHARHVSVRFVDSEKPQQFDIVVISAGQIGHVRTLHLEKVQIHPNNEGFIAVDGQQRTTNPRIFAAGDVTGAPLLANRALMQGRVAADVLAGQNSIFDARSIPMTIFTEPQLAWVGMTEQGAKAANITHACVKSPWGASGRAVGMGRADGLTKIIFEPESKLVLGVGMVGPHACEMISEAAFAIEMGATVTDLALTLHPHPSLSELLSDAARVAEHARS